MIMKILAKDGKKHGLAIDVESRLWGHAGWIAGEAGTKALGTKSAALAT